MKYYFESKDDEVCYPKSHFIEKMEEENLTEIDVFEAEKDKLPIDHFFCKEFRVFGGLGHGFEPCGNTCFKYIPRNGKSGCCKHYSKLTFEPGTMTTINL